MIYISFTNWKKKYEQKSIDIARMASDIHDYKRENMSLLYYKSENRNLRSRVERLLLELSHANRAFVKANEILTRHRKQPRGKDGRWIRKEGK